MRIAMTFLWLAGIVVATIAAATGLPDSGQNLCYDGTGLVACAEANTGDGATYPRQDGRFGHDAKWTTGTATKIGSGAVGFDYTKISNDGRVLGAGAAPGAGATDWACTRDNITGLTWEVKTASTTDLQHYGHTYTWYSTNGTTYPDGSTGSNTCSGTLPSNLCNTEAYVSAINGKFLCGNADWRLPTRRELLTLIDFGVGFQVIDLAYLPIQTSGAYWSATPRLGLVWSVSFLWGEILAYQKTTANLVILVRGRQF